MFCVYFYDVRLFVCCPLILEPPQALRKSIPADAPYRTGGKGHAANASQLVLENGLESVQRAIASPVGGMIGLLKMACLSAAISELQVWPSRKFLAGLYFAAG